MGYTDAVLIEANQYTQYLTKRHRKSPPGTTKTSCDFKPSYHMLIRHASLVQAFKIHIVYVQQLSLLFNFIY